jgi:hypothetical protein
MMTRATPIRIVPSLAQQGLSKGQKTFNTLTKKIDVSRKALSQWQEVVVTYQQKVATDFAPLLRQFRDLQGAMVRELDKALDQKGLTKAERETVQSVICDVAGHLMEVLDEGEFKAIYNKHSLVDFDIEEAALAVNMKNAMEQMFGFDLGHDADLKTPEDVMAQLRSQMEEISKSELEAQERRKLRKKTPKQVARQEAAKAQADETSLSIREVYRKLVSALHPDREPDAGERERKTTLMQRVNQAYDKRDLLRLLELQLELEHIDARTIAGLSEDRLRHFNKILKEQLAELDQEILHFELPLRSEFQMPPYLRLVPEQVIPRLKQNITELRRDISALRRELEVPRDLTAFKKWIKARRREAKATESELLRDAMDFPF